MEASAGISDKQMGFTAIFGLLAFAGAVAMALGEEAATTHAGWGFGAAIVFGTLLIVAIHIYD